MKKKFLSFLMAVAMCLAVCITAMPVVSAAGGTSVPIYVKADKTEAQPGDTITYTVTMGPITDMCGMQVDVYLPQEQTLVPKSAKMTDNLVNIINADPVNINGVDKGKYNGVDDNRVVILGEMCDYTATGNQELFTFQATVDEGAAGTSKLKVVPVFLDSNLDLIPSHVVDTESVLHVASVAEPLGLNIVLNDIIGLNLYMKLDPSVKDTDYMLFTMPNGGATYKVLKSEAKEDPKGMKFTCPIVAKEMADKVKAEFYANDKLVFKRECSIVDYAKIIMKNEGNQYTPETVELVRTMLNYGAAAQTYFQHNKTSPANEGFTAEQKTVPETNAFDSYTFKPVIKENNINGIEYAFSALDLDSTLGIKHYFTLNGDLTADDYQVKLIDGDGIAHVEKLPDKERGKFCIEIKDIYPQNLDKTYKLEISHSSEKIIIEYSPYTYARLVKNLTKGGMEPLKSLMNAMDAYRVAAQSYISKNQGGN